jgi:hypothetical protein
MCSLSKCARCCRLRVPYAVAKNQGRVPENNTSFDICFVGFKEQVRDELSSTSRQCSGPFSVSTRCQPERLGCCQLDSSLFQLLYDSVPLHDVSSRIQSERNFWKVFNLPRGLPGQHASKYSELSWEQELQKLERSVCLPHELIFCPADR